MKAFFGELPQDSSEGPAVHGHEGGNKKDAASLATGKSSLAALRRAAADCRACDLWREATQTVFGEGSPTATIVFVGEQPGDREDLAGRPFVGPAGTLLDEALSEAGIDRTAAYVTNAVKHFKWVPAERGKRRIHKKPRATEIRACRPWLDAEINQLKPEVLVCLGATAAQSLLGKDFSVSRQRGQLIESPLAPRVMATVHPSSILRAPDEDARKAQKQAFIQDLKTIAKWQKARSQPNKKCKARDLGLTARITRSPLKASNRTT